jgi:dTDP-glucose pyrophosphorylase
MIKNFIIDKKSTIKLALQKMKKFGTKCLFVCDNDNKLLGSLSDGDIRGALLKQKKISSNIYKIINFYPKYVYQQDLKKNKNILKNLFEKFHLEAIPIVNSEKKIKKLVFWSDLFKKNRIFKKIKILKSPKNNLQVVIMAGGIGTRLKPLTNALPKPMVPINNKTAIEHILDFFKKYGFRRFFISVNYKAEILKLYLKEISKTLKIIFIEEYKFLGTVSSLKLIKSNSDFLLTNCDVIHKVDLEDFIKFHYKNKYDLTLVAAKKKYHIPYGVCSIKNNIFEKINEKPNLNFYVNTGLYIIRKKLVDLIPQNKIYNVTDLIKKAKQQNYKIGIFKIKDTKWYDIGNWGELDRTIKNYK